MVRRAVLNGLGADRFSRWSWRRRVRAKEISEIINFRVCVVSGSSVSVQILGVMTIRQQKQLRRSNVPVKSTIVCEASLKTAALLRTWWCILSAIEGVQDVLFTALVVRHSILEKATAPQWYGRTGTAANLQLAAAFSAVTLALSLPGAAIFTSDRRAMILSMTERDVVSR
jgi:hypothetical protein